MGLVLVLAMAGTAQAELQQSTSYSMNESEVGTGGDFAGTSGNFRFVPGVDDAGSTLGENAVGNSASASYQSNGGLNPTAQPGLTFCIGVTGTGCADFSGSSVDLGELSTSVANTAFAKFSVKNYTSYGYAVTVIGTPPANGGNSLDAMGTQSANSTGCTPSCASANTVEQFGINLRLNSSPTTVGADPVPLPDASFSVSNPATIIPLPYRTANQYRYFSGDTIAQAPQSSGETTYTITFLANMSNTTPGGKYTGGLTLVATGTY